MTHDLSKFDSCSPVLLSSEYNCDFQVFLTNDAKHISRFSLNLTSLGLIVRGMKVHHMLHFEVGLRITIIFGRRLNGFKISTN